MSSPGKRSPHGRGSQEKTKKPSPLFIIAPLGGKNSPIRARSKYLERQIDVALRRLGFKAELITTSGDKERITDFMIQRLSGDRLAVAIMDGFNPNVMYEVAIRHTLCLPTIHLVEEGAAKGKKGKKGKTPFDLMDVEFIEYPVLSGTGGKFAWPNPVAENFRDELRKRAEAQLTAKPSLMFATGLRKASAGGMIGAVFAQKARELKYLVRELRLNIEHLVRDYKPDAPMEGPRAKTHADLLNTKYTRLHLANDTLMELIEGANLADFESEQCSLICRQISAVTLQLATVIAVLKTITGIKSASPKKAPRPTRRSVVDSLEKIIAQSLELVRQISALHASLIA